MPNARPEVSISSALHRTSPHLPATEVLTKTQMDVLIASSPPKLRKEITSFTIDWAVRAIARLGGYLEHRKNSALNAVYLVYLCVMIFGVLKVI